MAWAPDEEQAVRAVLKTSRWGVLGWKVLSELPNPVNFEAATTTVTEQDIREKFAVGPDAEPYERAVQKYADAGFDRLVLRNAGPDPDGFLDFYESRLSVRLRVPA